MQLQELAINSEAPDNYSPGLAAIPRPWAQLQALTRLELRGHRMLLALPSWLPGLGLLHLDVSCCPQMDLQSVGSFHSLQTLALQVLTHLLPCRLVTCIRESLGGCPAVCGQEVQPLDVLSLVMVLLPATAWGALLVLRQPLTTSCSSLQALGLQVLSRLLQELVLLLIYWLGRWTICWSLSRLFSLQRQAFA